jgi:hypothetical protein
MSSAVAGEEPVCDGHSIWDWRDEEFNFVASDGFVSALLDEPGLRLGFTRRTRPSSRLYSTNPAFVSALLENPAFGLRPSRWGAPSEAEGTHPAVACLPGKP